LATTYCGFCGVETAGRIVCAGCVRGDYPDRGDNPNGGRGRVPEPYRSAGFGFRRDSSGTYLTFWAGGIEYVCWVAAGDSIRVPVPGEAVSVYANGDCSRNGLTFPNGATAVRELRAIGLLPPARIIPVEPDFPAGWDAAETSVCGAD
jgi:hypothetical protein